MILRDGRDDDADGFIRLVDACWAEYPGCVMDLDGEVPELRALASYFAKAGGRVWAAEHDGAVVGMVATRPGQGGTGGTWELCKMYVSAIQRGAGGSGGTGVAAQLIATAEAHARAMGAEMLDLWTDTRFDRAHRFYERHGFVRAGAIRTLDDRSNSLEFHYAKPLSGMVVRALDTAAAASAARALGRILKACVDDGASVSFMPPFPLADAEAFYRRKASEIAAGKRVLLAAWVDGVMAGTVMLDLDMPPNQPHRLDLQKMLVTPDMRRRGLARVLLQAAEAEALAAGRRLMVLDTTTGSAGDAVYRSMGWQEVGSIPDFAYNSDGSLGGTTLFYKQLAA